jgi:hypothetical protein
VLLHVHKHPLPVLNAVIGTSLAQHHLKILQDNTQNSSQNFGNFLGGVFKILITREKNKIIFDRMSRKCNSFIITYKSSAQT